MNAAVEKKYFTVEEANQRLPLVRAIVEDIVHLYRDVHERRQRLIRVRQLPGGTDRDERSVYGEELRQIEQEIDKDISRLQDFVDELKDIGGVLKDPAIGLVDFRTLMDGREAYLCWQLGENEISYWHELDAGYQGRQPIFDTLLSGEKEPPGSDFTDSAR